MKNIYYCALLLALMGCGSDDKSNSGTLETVMSAQIGNTLKGEVVTNELFKRQQNIDNSNGPVDCYFESKRSLKSVVGVFNDKYIINETQIYENLNSEKSHKDCKKDMKKDYLLSLSDYQSTSANRFEEYQNYCSQNADECNEMEIEYFKEGNREVLKWTDNDNDTKEKYKAVIETIDNSKTAYINEHLYFKYIRTDYATNRILELYEINYKETNVSVVDKTKEFIQKFNNVIFSKYDYNYFVWSYRDGKFSPYVSKSGEREFEADVKCFYNESPEVMNVYSLENNDQYFVSIYKNIEIDKNKTSSSNIPKCEKKYQDDFYQTELLIFKKEMGNSIVQMKYFPSRELEIKPLESE